ncbi:MAG: SAM-dependent methyltransferase [Candidatus Brocadia sp.]|jgi:SAM-dependent MidA family methyltransferase
MQLLLKEVIIDKINKKGKITFAEFMQMVLYHPQYGYYNSDMERIGRFGDYYTSPTVHRMFGELIAKQLEEMWKIVGEGIFTVVEMGANGGWLCHDIIQCIKKEYPNFYDNLHYIIVETNPYAWEKQRLLLNSIGVPYENLFPDGPDKKVSWHTYTEEGFSFGRIQGCVLSNEYADALPVHRLKMKNKILKEVYVGYNTIDFYETDDEISSPSLADYIETNKIYLEEGQEYEVNLAVVEWLRHASEKLNKGFIITVDYGDITDGIHRKNNTRGTVRCYYKHTVNRDYYKRLGEQDITADVDFTSLMNAGRLLGLEVTGFTKQSHFLIALGILDKLNTIVNDTETILKVKNLFHPEGMGEVFKVLIQHKNIENPLLIGLRPLRSVTM